MEHACSICTHFHLPEHPPSHPHPAGLSHQYNSGQFSKSDGFLLKCIWKHAAVHLIYMCYHFWVEVFNILRVENSHESLRAYSLAAVLLSDHQCNVLWVVLKVVNERLTLASYGLDDTHTFFSPHNTVLTIQWISQTALKYYTSDEAECWGLGLIPHLLRTVLASRWYSRTSEKRIALFPRTQTVKLLLLESGFSTFTTWKDGSRVDAANVWCSQQCSWQLGNAVVRSLYLSHWNNDVALASILAGETQVVLRQAYLPKCVKMAEGHPQEAFMHFQQVFLFGKPEKCPELLALCMSFETSATQQIIIYLPHLLWHLPRLLPPGSVPSFLCDKINSHFWAWPWAGICHQIRPSEVSLTLKYLPLLPLTSSSKSEQLLWTQMQCEFHQTLCLLRLYKLAASANGIM